jgi:UrcA family protein
MQQRTLPCLIAAGFLTGMLGISATQAAAGPRLKDVIIEGKKLDPDSQRVVSYADLNLAARADQRKLDHRIFRTASDLCFYMNGVQDDQCTDFAVHSTDDQVAAAITRARLQMAGLPVGPAIQISMAIGN